MSPFPRPEYASLERYRPDRRPVAVDLSDNTSLRGPHPLALERIRNAGFEDVTKYPSVYAESLCQAVVDLFEIPPECVTTGCGSDDLIDSAFRAACPDGSIVAYPAPTFGMAEIFARVNGCRPVPVAWEEAAEDPARLLRDDPALVYVCRPNNPTGTSLPREWVLQLLDEAGSEGPVVVLDEAYAPFADDSFLSDAPETHRLLVLRTLSKAHGLAGLRVGFAVGPAEVVGEVEKSRGPYKVSRLAEAAARLALLDPEGWVERLVLEVRSSRERLIEELVRRGLGPLPSQANFVLVPVDDAAALTAALREEGVGVRPFPGLTGLGGLRSAAIDGSGEGGARAGDEATAGRGPPRQGPWDAIRVSVGPWVYVERFLDALDRVRAEASS